MPNMSYCRFQNTYEDLKECLGALERKSPLSSEEYRAAIRLFRAVLDFCQDEGIIEDFDTDRLKEYLDKLHKGRD